ncbi:MAG: F0F1 ATP synthase subunit A [Patescibacteria group bacterium]
MISTSIATNSGEGVLNTTLFDPESTEDSQGESIATSSVHINQDADHSEFEVALKAQHFGMIGNFPITNSMITSLVGSLILVIFVLIFSLRIKTIPSRIQSLFELLVEKGYEFTNSIIENEAISKKTFPLVASLFIFIVFFNLIKFIPGSESITFNDELLFKPLHSDLNMTIALALTAFIFVQITGIFVLGLFRYGSKFINIRKPLSIPLGLIELVSEAAKLVSLSFRLFGNILVGGILLLLVSHTVHFILPVPLILFEIFVAFLQAGIFALLTIIYVKLATDEPH